jgi:LysM repeat protein
MTAKRTFQLIAIVAILATSFASTHGVLAGGNCATYITVQWGDTLSGLAAYCGTTVEAIHAANPGLGWWLYAGQVLYIPNGYASAPAYRPQAGSTYVVQWGDTLGNIAMRNGYALSDILAVNPQIWNINLIYPGQVINLPGAMNVPPVAYNPPAAIAPPAFVTQPPPITDIVTPIPTSIPTTSLPTATPTNTVPQYSVLRVIYAYGLLVRTGPGKEYKVIDSEYVSAMFSSNWWYRKNSAVVDSKGFVWVEVNLSPLVKEYKTGWIMVKDPAGEYFTLPNIDP